MGKLLFTDISVRSLDSGGKLDSSDLFKGLKVAVWTAVITSLYQVVSTGGSIVPLDVFHVALLATLGYLFHKLTSPSQEIVLPAV